LLISRHSGVAQEIRGQRRIPNQFPSHRDDLELVARGCSIIEWRYENDKESTMGRRHDGRSLNDLACCMHPGMDSDGQPHGV